MLTLFNDTSWGHLRRWNNLPMTLIQVQKFKHKNTQTCLLFYFAFEVTISKHTFISCSIKSIRHKMIMIMREKISTYHIVGIHLMASIVLSKMISLVDMVPGNAHCYCIGRNDIDLQTYTGPHRHCYLILEKWNLKHMNHFSVLQISVTLRLVNCECLKSNTNWYFDHSENRKMING